MLRDYLQFGQMLLSGGQLNGKRLLSPKTVELMSAVHAADTTIAAIGNAIARGDRIAHHLHAQSEAAAFWPSGQALPERWEVQRLQQSPANANMNPFTLAEATD